MPLQCVKRIQNLWKERLTNAFTMREKDTKLVEGEADKCLYTARKGTKLVEGEADMCLYNE